jgi:hypothetical protein
MTLKVEHLVPFVIVLDLDGFHSISSRFVSTVNVGLDT